MRCHSTVLRTTYVPHTTVSHSSLVSIKGSKWLRMCIRSSICISIYMYAWSSLPPFAASLPSPDPVARRSSGGVAYGVHAYIFIYHPPENIGKRRIALLSCVARLFFCTPPRPVSRGTCSVAKYPLMELMYKICVENTDMWLPIIWDGELRRATTVPQTWIPGFSCDMQKVHIHIISGCWQSVVPSTDRFINAA